MTNERNTTKLNIDNHYVMSDIENKIISFEYPILKNEKLEKELNIIYNSIQNIKELIENNKITY
jgi:hypothetical protein